MTFGLDGRAELRLGEFAVVARRCEVGADEGAIFTSSQDVLDSWSGGVRFRQASSITARDGLRRAQLGAIHAVVAHWSTGRQEPATVVLPTGTGKTETMLALLVESRVPRLLVIVPTDALRTQIAEKFESLGLLHELGIVGAHSLLPSVARITGGVRSSADADLILDSAQVIVSTPHAFLHSDPEAKARLLAGCDALFIDEAHHVRAQSWSEIRDAFAAKPIVQFTATPFREDGQHLQGKFVYVFPLAEAQADGVFSRIKYESVFDLATPDESLASRAIEVLREDLSRGLDHLLMARCASRNQAGTILDLYREKAADLNPVILHSGRTEYQRKAALDEIRSRRSRVIVCVDMLGEGFDLPQLKVAAMHDPRQSLAPTLQLAGRFARVSNGTGDATVVAARTEKRRDRRLSWLYTQDADWNLLLADMTRDAVDAQQKISEFETRFGTHEAVSATQAIAPKMSTVVYKTRCSEWDPEAVSELVDEEDFAAPLAINATDHVAWFVTRARIAVPWVGGPGAEDVVHGLFVMHWDSATNLLYINQSANDGVSGDLARAVAGNDVELVSGEVVYRAMGGLLRPVPTNIGVLDIYSRARRFTMHVGADVSEGVDASEEATKVQTNVFAVGFHEGERSTIGVSLKGRIWSYLVAQNIFDWVAWCHGVGARLLDDSLDVAEIKRNFIRPEVLTQWPDLVPLAVEWPADLLLDPPASLSLRKGAVDVPFHDVSLQVDRALTEAGALRIHLVTEDFSGTYDVRVDDVDGMVATVVGDEVAFVTSQRSTPGEVFINRFGGVIVLFGTDALVTPPGVLIRVNREIEPLAANDVTVVDWSGIALNKESRGQDKDEATVQGRCLQILLDEDWEVVVDDDGPGEIADLVAFRLDARDRLSVRFVHCKYSSAEHPGGRIGDMYEVCGQAQKSAAWRRQPAAMIDRLVKRERTRIRNHRRAGLERGTPSELLNLIGEAESRRIDLEVVIAQPGLGRTSISNSQLSVLGATRTYLRETAASTLSVWCSE